MTPAPVGGVSVVCVYNDPGVRSECLDRSIAEYDGPLDIEYLPVDNTEHRFASAGSALNHGARAARHDVVAFAHQDVFVHSWDRVAAMGAHLQGDTWSLLGACGRLTRGGNVGRMRDRLQLSGAAAPHPVAVESVDEVAFLVRRDRLLEHPLTEDPDLAWHAYAVEYGLRLRRHGLMVGAADLAVTHNSLTINLDRFVESHRRLARLYPDLLPVQTTCGTIRAREPRWRGLPIVRRHGWRVRRMKESVGAERAARRLGLPVVLSDIRDDVDLLEFSANSPLHLINVDHEGGFVDYGREQLTVSRHGRRLRMSAVSSVEELIEALRASPRSASVLVTDVTLADLVALRGRLDPQGSWVMGLQYGSVWLLGGPAARRLPREWSASRVRQPA